MPIQYTWCPSSTNNAQTYEEEFRVLLLDLQKEGYLVLIVRILMLTSLQEESSKTMKPSTWITPPNSQALILMCAKSTPASCSPQIWTNQWRCVTMRASANLFGNWQDNWTLKPVLYNNNKDKTTQRNDSWP